MEITDPQALRALAHPLRLDLIELLGTAGALTAAESARRLGSTQASCSYHLRQLAKYGYVEKAPVSEDGRENPWRLTEVRQSWSGASPAAGELERVFIQREADKVIAWQGERAGQPSAWREAAFVTGASLPLTSAELDDVREHLAAVLEPYIARLTDTTRRPEGSRFVRVLLAGTPAPTAEGEGTS
ncbi:helix-turn-helix domain-containing protein [Microbacterium terrisoli]|jgi:DNA-binding transcriptional ArsR family regulator|uniref:helix-turn-helix domain-containing protein n=1 Tax=Microbacterium terrisoli TaxID=3242192 RepID=UPI0028059449|nr:helix-turn-helix domain-containing protein [Microbacterium protaetiae]